MARAKTKSNQKSTKTASSKGSEIVRQSVIYVQAIAAYEAGFDADHSDDGPADASALGGAQLKCADNAMHELNRLGAKSDKLSVSELNAKAAVLKAMLKNMEGSEFKDCQREFMSTFAREVAGHFGEATSA